MHRSPPNAVANGPSAVVNGASMSSSDGYQDESSASKMREKLAALEDLNELLEEPVEEQVSYF